MTSGKRFGVLTLALMASLASLALLLFGLAGCGPNDTVADPTPVPTLSGGGLGTPGAHPTLTLPSPSAESTSGTTGQQGVNEFCSKKPAISIRPGANIPVYPGAALHFSQANGSDAFYGYCASASTSAVQDYYAQQLPQHGWPNPQIATISSVVQLSALQCASQDSPKIIVTIAPDTTGAATTSISIVVLAGTC